MERCYNCRGKLQRKLVDVPIQGIVAKDLPAEVCSRCGEQYFDTETTTFVQNVARFVDHEKEAVLLGVEVTT